MARTVRRKPSSVRRQGAARKREQARGRAKERTGSAIGRAMALLPLSEEQWSRVFLIAILAGLALLAWTVASLAGLPQLAHARYAAAAADAGFAVRQVRVTGIERMNELKVYERVLAERDQPMPLVDLDAIRAGLLDLPWVKDARVSRQLPDRLVIDIVERTPHAVLKKPGRLVLIDPDGHELEPISPGAARGRLVVSGPGVARQVPDLRALLGAAPALKPKVAEAEWIGNRRWNLTFDTGQLLLLPEGSDPAATALIGFAEGDGRYRYLGGRLASFDMRVSGRMFGRLADGQAAAFEQESE